MQDRIYGNLLNEDTTHETSVNEERSILAIDLGSGGPKVAVVTEQGEILAQAREAVATYFVEEQGAEQNPNEWWQAVEKSAKSILVQPGVNRSHIVAVSCTGQWSVTVPVDRDGQPLMNAVHWMDGRGAPYTRAATNGIIKIEGYGIRRLFEWIRFTGGVPTHSGADALAHILFIKHKRPDVYERTHKFLEPMDFLNLRLTGRACASFGTVFPYLLTDNRDVTRVCYHDRLLCWTGIDRDKLPELVPAETVLGPIVADVARDWGLSPETQIVAGTPDNQTAALGAGSVDDFEGYISVGTTSWLSCHVPFKKTNVFTSIATMPSAIPDRNIVVAEQGAAGRCLEAVVERLLYADHDLSDNAERARTFEQVLQEAADAPAGANGLLFLPWVNGSGPPAANSQVRGGFLNLTLQTSRAEAIRSVLEGIAFNLRWLLPHVERFVGRRFDTLRIVGGAAESDLWCQVFADVLDRPIRKIDQPRLATLRGAALHALMSLGIQSRETVPSLVPVSRVFEPNEEHRHVYQKLFAAFVKSHKRTRGLFSRLKQR